MSEFIYAIIGLIVGGTVGVLVMSMLTVSKRADEEAEAMIKQCLYASNNLTQGICCDCEGPVFWSEEAKGYRCEHCDK